MAAAPARVLYSGVTASVQTRHRATETRADNRSNLVEMTTTLILGAGVGGIVTAHELRAKLPAPHRIVLVSRDTSFSMGTTKTWVMLGTHEPTDVTRTLDGLRGRGIDLVRAEIRSIDVRARTVTTDAGSMYGDHLVLALGADVDGSGVPGLAEHAESFYTLDGAMALRDRLSRFDGGDLVLLVAGAPFKCPPAPYEAAFLLHDALSARGIRNRARLSVHTVEPRPMPTAGPRMGEIIVSALGERDIAFHPRRRVVSVDGAARTVHFEDGSSARYDLLVAVPPHRAPAVVREAGLTSPSGWVPVDPLTLRVVACGLEEPVFAVGDVTVTPLPGRFQPDAPLALPKAGIFAERQARVVANEIAARVTGKTSRSAFDGVGFCYIELARDVAMRGDGWFFELPHPRMQPTAPSAALAEEKRRWVSTWLDTYLPR